MSENETLTKERETGTGERKENFAQRLYTSDFHFNFVENRRRWYILSAVMLLICIGALLIRGLNLGIEFKGGSVFQAPVASSVANPVSTVTDAIQESGVSDLSAQVQMMGEDRVRVQTRSLETDEISEVRSAIGNAVGINSDEVTYTLIGPSWGQQITNQGLIAVLVFMVLVFLLIWIYFRDWQMSLSAIVALIHDIIVTVGVYALVGFTVSPSTLTGFLTILGYSLYDTVVVFDKVKENTSDLARKKITYSDAANQAINQVLVRSINTTIIGILPVIAILIAGVAVLNGDGPLADIGLALLVGMIAGAYSSIFIATPLLAGLRERTPEMVQHRKNLAKSSRAKAKVEAVAVDTTQSVTSTPLVPAQGSITYSAPSSANQTGSASTAQAAKQRSVSDANAGRPQPKRTARGDRKK